MIAVFDFEDCARSWECVFFFFPYESTVDVTWFGLEWVLLVYDGMGIFVYVCSYECLLPHAPVWRFLATSAGFYVWWQL